MRLFGLYEEKDFPAGGDFLYKKMTLNMPPHDAHTFL